MTVTYTTTLFADGWTCNCPSPYTPDPAERMTAEQAEVDADHHVDHYEATWPHQRRWSQR